AQAPTNPEPRPASVSPPTTRPSTPAPVTFHLAPEKPRGRPATTTLDAFAKSRWQRGVAPSFGEDVVDRARGEHAFGQASERILVGGFNLRRGSFGDRTELG